MELSDEKLDLVYRYLSGEMDPVEERNFEEELESDPSLQEEVRMLREVDDVLLEEEWTPTEFEAGNEKAKQYFDHFNKEENKAFYQELKDLNVSTSTESTTSSGKSTLKWLSRAAVIALIGVFGYVLLFNQPSTGKLYDKYAETEALPGLTERSGGEFKLGEAEKLFRTGDYENAKGLFENYLNAPEQGNKDLVKLYLSLTEAELGNYEKSLSLVNGIASDNNSMLSNQAQFYEAMITLKSGDKKTGKDLLESISENTNHPYNKKAIRILKKL